MEDILIYYVLLYILILVLLILYKSQINQYIYNLYENTIFKSVKHTDNIYISQQSLHNEIQQLYQNKKQSYNEVKIYNLKYQQQIEKIIQENQNTYNQLLNDMTNKYHKSQEVENVCKMLLNSLQSNEIVQGSINTLYEQNFEFKGILNNNYNDLVNTNSETQSNSTGNSLRHPMPYAIPKKKEKVIVKPVALAQGGATTDSVALAKEGVEVSLINRMRTNKTKCLVKEISRIKEQNAEKEKELQHQDLHKEANCVSKEMPISTKTLKKETNCVSKTNPNSTKIISEAYNTQNSIN